MSAKRKVIPLRDKEQRRERLVRAMGAVLARKGFLAASVDEVVEEAGVDRAFLFRHFNGLRELTAAYGKTARFWPTVEELLGDDPEALAARPPGAQMAAFFNNYMDALRGRPETREIMAWESLERNDLTRELDEIRVRRSLELFEHIQGDFPEDVDLSALVALMAGAFQFLAVRSRLSRHYGGVDLQSDKGWRRLQGAMDIMLRRALDPAETVESVGDGRHGAVNSDKNDGA